MDDDGQQLAGCAAAAGTNHGRCQQDIGLFAFRGGWLGQPFQQGQRWSSEAAKTMKDTSCFRGAGQPVVHQI